MENKVYPTIYAFIMIAVPQILIEHLLGPTPAFTT